VEVNDIQAVVAELRRRDVMFEEVDVPGLRTVEAIAEVEDDYPSAGVGERAPWFRDSEGNLLGIGQAVRERERAGHGSEATCRAGASGSAGVCAPPRRPPASRVRNLTGQNT
jgi:hypothetical protein